MPNILSCKSEQLENNYIFYCITNTRNTLSTNNQVFLLYYFDLSAFESSVELERDRLLSDLS